MKRFIGQREGVISPVRRLPTEILQAIFIDVDLTTRVHGQLRRTLHLPWKLAQVCRIWRESALSLSLLWNRLPIVFVQLEKSRTGTQLAYLTELIRRSGEAPLEFYIVAINDDLSPHPVIELLTQHSERWRHACIKTTAQTIRSFQTVKGRLPFLKTLALDLRYCTEMMPIEMFEVAPQLEAVSFVNWPKPGDLKLPFSQLLHYKEQPSWPGRIREVVASPLLQSLTILDLFDPVTFPVVTIHTLLKLHVTFHYQESMDYFTNLTIPAIQDIKAITYRGRLIPSLTSLLARCEPYCPLKTLWILEKYREPESLTPLLELTPCLVSLDTSTPVSLLDIRNLTGREGHKPLAPLLETCKFFCEDIVTSETILALNALASARCDVSEDYAQPTTLTPSSGEVRRLKTLCIRFNSPSDCKPQARLDGWPLADSRISAELRGLKKQLHFELPDLGLLGLPWTMESQRFDGKRDERAGDILDKIEDVMISDPAEIYVTYLHISLERLSNADPTSQWAKEEFRQRASDILHKWTPSFLEDLPRRHWAFQGRSSLHYISPNNSLRTSSEALSIIYGLPLEESPILSIFWDPYTF